MFDCILNVPQDIEKAYPSRNLLGFSGVFMVNFKHILRLVLVFLSSTLNM